MSLDNDPRTREYHREGIGIRRLAKWSDQIRPTPAAFPLGVWTLPPTIRLLILSFDALWTLLGDQSLLNPVKTSLGVRCFREENGSSLSLKDVSCGDRSLSISHLLAWSIRSFMQPVTERLSAFENWTVALAGAMNC